LMTTVQKEEFFIFWRYSKFIYSLNKLVKYIELFEFKFDKSTESNLLQLLNIPSMMTAEEYSKLDKFIYLIS